MASNGFRGPPKPPITAQWSAGTHRACALFACMSGLAGSCAGASTRISALRVERNAPQAVAALIVSSPQRDARSGVSGHALRSAAAIPCHRNSVPSCPSAICLSAHLPICPSAHLPYLITSGPLVCCWCWLAKFCWRAVWPAPILKKTIQVLSGALRHVLLKTVKCSMWETNSLAMW